jgi:hypothetical protein
MQRKASSAADWWSALKYNTVRNSTVVVEKTINISLQEFNDLCDNFLADSELVKNNQSSMWFDEDKWHVLAVTTDTSDTVILIESEGFNYPRYTAVTTKAELQAAA